MGKTYGVTLTHLTERETPDGQRMLTGRLGDAVVIGLQTPVAAGAAPRWRFAMVEPMRSGGPGSAGASLADPAALARFAARAARRPTPARG